MKSNEISLYKVSSKGKYGYIECANLRDERCPNGTEEQKKQVFKTIKFKSQRFMQLMQARKGFINNHPKKKRVGRYTGMTNKYKKAIVKLASGSTISFD